LLGRGKQEGSEKPLVQRDFGALEHSSNRHRELLAARVALIDPGTVRLTLKRRHGFRIGVAAMRAKRTVRPALLFEIFAGLVSILEDWVIQFHGSALSMLRILNPCAALSSI